MAHFAVDAAWDSLPEPVRREAARAWLNWVACAIGGARTATMDAAVRGSQSMQAHGDVPVLGRLERTSVTDAALLGCLSSSTHTYDDTHLATITHPTGPVASAALAVAAKLSAQGRPVQGAHLLAALAVGLELTCRTSCAIAGRSSKGWYMTGLSGGIGAAAAAGRLLGLDREQMEAAIGLAAAQGCGFRATHGSMAIAYVPGLAARNGVAAAYMAAGGFECSTHAVDGKYGLLDVLTGGTDAGPIRDGLGRRYEFLNNTYKPYPCGIVIHPTIDACLALYREDGVRPEDIIGVELRVHPDALNLTWRKLPDTVLDAQVSLFHWAAVVLARGAAGVAQGEIDCVMDSQVRGLQSNMHAEADPDLADNQAMVVVRLRNGKARERFTRNAIGSVTNPMTDAQLAGKFSELVTPVLGEAASARWLQACVAIEQAADAAEIAQQAH